MLNVINLLSSEPVPYVDAFARQKELVALRQREEIPDTLLLLTHPPTVTYGKAADHANLLLPEDKYAIRRIELIPTDRGGDVTYHGPGQLIGYPILHLGEGRRDLHRYVRFLESVIIAAAGDLGVVGAGRADFHAGVWVGDGYLSALGVKVSRWVTHHGFALNVTEEVKDGFSTIIPCGVQGKNIVTIAQLAGRDITVAEAADAVATCFQTQYRTYLTATSGVVPVVGEPITLSAS